MATANVEGISARKCVLDVETKVAELDEDKHAEEAEEEVMLQRALHK
jgi:hypothetical protein